MLLRRVSELLSVKVSEVDRTGVRVTGIGRYFPTCSGECRKDFTRLALQPKLTADFVTSIFFSAALLKQTV